MASNFGILGSHGCGLLQPEQLEKDIMELKSLTSKPFNINLQLPRPNLQAEKVKRLSEVEVTELLTEIRKELKLTAPKEIRAKPNFFEQLKMIEKNPPKVFSYCFGRIEKDAVKRLKDKGILVVGTATNLQEALDLEEDGVDAIVLQGSEAGGHRSTYISDYKSGLIGISTLLPLVYSRIKSIPLIAAGGITNGKQVRALLSLGAQLCQIGTLFIPTLESSISLTWKENVLRKSPDGNKNTVITSTLTGAPCRVLENKLVRFLATWEERGVPRNMAALISDVLRNGGHEFGISMMGQGSENDAAKAVLRTSALQLLDAGAVVRRLSSYGNEEQLPYRMKRHQTVHSTGRYVSILFDSSPKVMKELHKTLGFDERVIRRSVVNVADTLKKSSELHVTRYNLIQ
ncbi:hypothetical protein HDU92_002665 [Lobulomyces angularis]|nr:hypothetical protein HDU92_002665 [Lobulomyces angularis]